MGLAKVEVKETYIYIYKLPITGQISVVYLNAGTRFMKFSQSSIFIMKRKI